MVLTDHPTHITTDEFVERLKKLMDDNVAGSKQLLTSFLALAKEASQSSCSGEQLDLETMLSRCLEFHLAAYSVVSTQGLALLNGLLSAAREAVITKGMAASSAKASAAPVELQLEGKHGERATTRFILENRFDLPIAVMFESTELTPAVGSPLSASVVSFEPTTVTIKPHEEGVVEISVTITSDFVTGQTYTAKIRPLGFGEFGERELRLSLRVLPEPTAASPPVGRRTKQAKKALREAK